MPASTRSFHDLPAPAPPPAASLQADMERVVCPNCASRYRFPTRSLSEGRGLRVTCPACESQFVAVAPKPVAPTVPFPALMGLDDDILDLWVDGRARRRRMFRAAAAAAILLLAGWGVFGGESDPVVAQESATVAEATAPATTLADVSPEIAAILAAGSTDEAPVAVDGVPPAAPAPVAAKPAPVVMTASVVPRRPAATPAPKPAASTPVSKRKLATAPSPKLAPAPAAAASTPDRATAGLHWYGAAMDAKSAGNLALAEQMMKRALAKAATRADWWAEIGEIQQALGNADGAERSSRRASYLMANAD